MKLITLKAVFILEIKDSLVFVVFLVPVLWFRSTATSFFRLLLVIIYPSANRTAGSLIL